MVLLLATQACAQSTNPREVLIELRLARNTAAPGFAAMRSLGDTTFFVAGRAIVSDSDIVEANTINTHDGLLVRVRLTSSAAARLSAATKRHLGERIAVLTGGKLNGAPVVKGALSATERMLDIALQLPQSDAARFASAVAARWPSGHS